MKDKDTVVKFPGKGTDSSLPTPESVKKAVEDYNHEVINELTEIITEEFALILMQAGFDVEQEGNFFDFCMLGETLRALISRKYKTHHAFHDFCERLFLVDAEGKVMFTNPQFKVVEKEPT